MATMPAEVQECSRDAMYGGRFETLAVGPVPGMVQEWDLHSAYPAAMSDLPCFVHGKWSRTRSRHGEYSLSHISFEDRTPDGPGIAHPLPVRRRTGELFYPATGSGWYWRHEFEHDIPGWNVTRDITYSWVPDGCECSPFGWVPELFAERQRMDTERPGSGIALKLCLNTLYGKLAQTKPVPGPFLCFAYASIITSKVRRRIYDTYLSLPPGSAVMFATDAVFVRGEHAIPTTGGLGEYEHADDYHDLTIIQPGMYFDRAAVHYKTRGIPRRVVEAYGNDIRAASILGETVTVSLTQFRGLRLSLVQRGRDMGEWVDIFRTIETRTKSKRIGEYPDATGLIWTAPARNGFGESFRRTPGMPADIRALIGDLEGDGEPAEWSSDGA
jgi:hypothetical protein